MSDPMTQDRIAAIRERLGHAAQWSQKTRNPVDVFDLADLLAAYEAAQREIDAFWQMVEFGWEIEPRAYFEREAARMGYGSALAMAAHHMWKRRTKELAEDALRPLGAQQSVAHLVSGLGLDDDEDA